MVGAAQIAAGLAFALALSGAVRADDFRVEGNCRDGYAHGLYELRDMTGNVRVVGAFNRGKRTGSFLFWTASGAREAQLPFDDDQLSGTAALWWPALPQAEARPRAEAAYARGRHAGGVRTWYRNGKPAVEMYVGDGDLRITRAASETGVALSEAEARGVAAGELGYVDGRIAGLLALVDANLPRCEPASNRLEKS